MRSLEYLFLFAIAVPASFRPDSVGYAFATDVSQAELPPLDQAGIQEGLRFIASRLSEKEFGDNVLHTNKWSPFDIRLDTTVWEWTEGTYQRRSGVILDDFIEYYRLHPKELGLPVYVDKNQVVFECALDKCISVAIEERVRDYSKKQSSTMTAEKRALNRWHFRNKEEAERVARAMNAVLRALGARDSRF